MVVVAQNENEKHNSEKRRRRFGSGVGGASCGRRQRRIPNNIFLLGLTIRVRAQVSGSIKFSNKTLLRFPTPPLPSPPFPAVSFVTHSLHSLACVIHSSRGTWLLLDDVDDLLNLRDVAEQRRDGKAGNVRARARALVKDVAASNVAHARRLAHPQPPVNSCEDTRGLTLVRVPPGISSLEPLIAPDCIWIRFPDSGDISPVPCFAP